MSSKRIRGAPSQPVLRHALVLSLATAACATDPGGTPSTVVRDSAGIRIVENSAPQWAEGEGWTIEAEPFLTIGNRAGEPPLSNIVGVTRLSDGRIVVGDAGGPSILYFDASGALQLEAGRAGEGPGEFIGLTSVRPFRGDSVMAHDFQSSRLALFSPSGTFARTIPIERMVGNALYEPFHVTPEGHVIWTPFLFGRTRTTETGWEDQPIVRTRDEGVELDTIATLPTRYLAFEGGQSVAQGLPPHGVFGRVPTGLLWARTDRPEVHRIAFDAVHTETLRWEAELIPITDDVREALVDAAAEQAISGVDGASFSAARRRQEDRRYPDFAPPIMELIADATGAIWVRGRKLPNGDSGRRWQVLREDGVWLGEILLPERFTVFEIGSDYVLGVGVDDFDVPTVVLHRVVKR